MDHDNKLVLKFKGEYLTIMPSKFSINSYGIIYRGQSVWKYKGKTIFDLQTAKLVAFDIFDAMR